MNKKIKLYQLQGGRALNPWLTLDPKGRFGQIPVIIRETIEEYVEAGYSLVGGKHIAIWQAGEEVKLFEVTIEPPPQPTYTITVEGER